MRRHPAGVAEAHWTEQLFLDHADIFMRIVETRIDVAQDQARQIAGILHRGDVKAPARILDAPCGIGRHAIHLEKLGFHVTGVDFAPAFLDRGRRLAVEAGTKPEFVQADLREIRQSLAGRDGTFSAILDLWTSIGYWSEEVDRDILRQFRSLAVPGGLLVVDTLNRDFLLTHFRRFSRDVWGDIVHIEEGDFDAGTSWQHSTWHFYRQREQDLLHETTIPVSHRVYAPHELKRLAESAGWRTVGLFGGLGMEPVAAERPRAVLVARNNA